MAPHEPTVVHPCEAVWTNLDILDLDGADAGWLHAVETRAEQLFAQEDPHESRPAPLTAREEPVAVKLDAMIGMPLARHGSGELTHTVEHLTAARALHEVMLVNVLAELHTRGEDAPGGLRPLDWLRSLDPTLTAAQAKDFLTVARALTEPRWQELAARVSMQHLTIGKAARIIDFTNRNEHVADPDELATAVTDLLGQAPDLAPEDFTRLVRHHTDQVRPPRDQLDDLDDHFTDQFGDTDGASDGEQPGTESPEGGTAADQQPEREQARERQRQREQERQERLDAGRRASRGLWFSQPSATGMVTLRAVLDPEAAAIIKSALDPLSAPCPETDGHGHTIAPDPRTPARRRADALLEVIARGVASADGIPTTDRTKLVITIDLDALTRHLRGSGLTTSGDILTPATVRRLACDAAIIPMVLGSHGEPLDVGREKRLVTPGLRAALWQRDRGCSYPGCTTPAAWTDAHHVRPWWAGGPTSLLNMALLCRKHHTYIHRHEHTATVTSTSVTWHLDTTVGWPSVPTPGTARQR